MRFRIRQDLFSNQKRLVIVICIVIIVIIAIFGTTAMLDNTSSSEISAVILVDYEILRVGEIFTFDGSNSTGDIKSYVWDFGDGSISNEAKPTYQYGQPGWYNVTLMVLDENGDNDTALVNIGVQYDDEVFNRNLNRMFNLFGTSSVTNTIPIGPNAGEPTLDIDITLDVVVGRGYVVIYVSSVNLNELIYLGPFTGTGSSYTNSIIIGPDDIPNEVAFQESYIYFEMGIDEGYWSGGTIDFQCIFPMDNISPPTY